MPSQTSAKRATSRRKGRATSTPPNKPARKSPNEARRNRGPSVCDGAWTEFVDNLENEIASLSRLQDDIRKAPFYSLPNVVKRAVYRFAIYARKNLKAQALEDTIDNIRVADAGRKVTLRTLRKDIKRETYFWILTGLHLDCPAANIRKPDITRFAQHLNYAHRHKVPPEFLVGFLLQSGSLATVYKHALDPAHLEPWYIAKQNS